MLLKDLFKIMAYDVNIYIVDNEESIEYTGYKEDFEEKFESFLLHEVVSIYPCDSNILKIVII